MVRRIVVLCTLLIIFLPIARASGAPPAIRLSGSFARASYVPRQTFAFTLVIRSRKATTDARISFVVLAKRGGGKTLVSRLTGPTRLRKGTTRVRFSAPLRPIGAVDGVYPATCSVRAGGIRARLRAQLVVVDPKRHGPMLVAIVWNVDDPARISTKGVYLSDEAAHAVRSGRSPGPLVTHLSELASHPSMRVSFNITPEFLNEVRGVAGGYRLREDRKIVRVGAESSQSAEARAFFNRCETLRRAGRIELVPAPYAYPALPELAGRRWVRDIGLQLSRARVSLALAFDVTSTPGFFAPQLRLPAAVVPLLRRAGIKYAVVSPIPRADTFRATAVAAGSDRTLKVVMNDATAARIVTSPRPPADVVRDLVLHLARVRLARGRRPTAATIVLPPSGPWRPAPALVDALYSAIGSAKWMKPATVGRAVEGTLGRPRRVPRLPVQRMSRRLKPYFSRIARARRSLAIYAAMAEAGSPAVARLERNLLISESANWTENGPAARERGLLFAGDVTRTVSSELAKISAPETQTITLPAQSGKVPLTISNGTRYALRVTVRLTGSRVDFPEGSSRQLLLRPRDNYLTVPVSVRAGGDASVRVTIIGGGLTLGRSLVRVRTTYFNRMVFLSAIIVALVGLLVIIYRKAGANARR